MSPEKRTNFVREKERRSLIDGLSTTIINKKGKVVFRGKDNADALIKRVDPLGRKVRR